MAFRRLLRGPGEPRFAADWLLVGLGNPGEQHARNRHNVGFWVADEVARRANIQPRVTGGMMAIAAGSFAGTRMAVVKPRTFMNQSGKAVAQALQWTGCDLLHTVVVYDELDLPCGALRIRAGGGHGGHNGLRSIGQHAGLDFIRIRIGIGRPRDSSGEPTWDPEIVAGYVLGDPRGDERSNLEETARLAADAVETIVREGPDVAGSRFNRR